MFRHKYYIVAAIMVVVISFGAASCTLSDTPGDIQSLRGILKTVDSISGEITVILDDGSIVTFNLNDVNVETIGEALGNASLEIGSEVIIVKDKGGKITSLNAQTAEVEGVIKRLDPVKQQITITLNEKGQLTLNVTNTTLIIFESDIEGTFAHLKAGQKIEATYNVGNRNALKLHIYQEEYQVKGEVRGKITLIDVGAKTITIQSETGLTTPPLKVTPSTKLWFGKVGTFDMFYVGMEVKVKYNPETRELLRLQGEDTRSPIERFLNENS
jgi:hypothetical protein